MADQNTFQEQIIARAMNDERFRQHLLSNPKATLESDLGITVAEGVTIQVHEDTSTTIHIILPMKPATGTPHELTDEELEQAVGGTDISPNYFKRYPYAKDIPQ